MGELRLSPLDIFLTEIERAAGLKLNIDKMSLIENRLRPRLMALKLNDLEEYYKFACNDQEEFQVCLEHLVTHKTEWFREIEHFQFVQKQLKQYRTHNTPFMAWSAACSSGEELYSLFFLLIKNGFQHDAFKLLGTDVSRPILNKALALSESRAFSEQAQLLQTKFPSHNIIPQIELALEHSVKFRQHNLVTSPPLEGLKFDVIFLRNVLIYFDPQTVKQVVTKLTKNLKPNGYFIIGMSESLGHSVPELERVASSVYKLAK